MSATGETDQTLRYRAATRYTYAQALTVLTEYARGSDADFEAGPLDLAALEHQGLTVTGPDLGQVRKILARIPGLIED
jgi:ribosomal protein L29